MGKIVSRGAYAALADLSSAKCDDRLLLLQKQGMVGYRQYSR